MAITTLLIPTDGSDSAERAAHRGFDIAETLGASVHVLSVADSSIATGAGYSGDSSSIRKRLRETADDRASSLRKEATERGLDATAVVREGLPAQEIVKYANKGDIDVITLGTSGRGVTARAVIGSVADKVVRTASVPVVTITREAMNGTDEFESILLPTDGSETAEAAVRLGTDIAEQLDAIVHLLSVVDRDRAKRNAVPSNEDETSSKERLDRVRERLKGITADARERGLDVRTTVLEGDPAETILDYAESESVDLIAMGTAGRGGFERLLVGSVADEVVRTASVPVVTTRPETEPTNTPTETRDDPND